MIAELNGVSLSFGEIDALTDVDLSVDVGERVALVGPSGAGKSSVLNMLAGLTPPSHGTATVLRTDLSNGIAALSNRERRLHGRRVGTVSQHADLVLAMRVVHNVNAGRLGDWGTLRALWSLVRPAGRGRVRDVLDLVGLADRIDARTADLSGGERQRVAVARVLHQRPELILADEPTSAVDPSLSDTVMHLLCPGDDHADDTGRADATSRASIVSLHDPDLARRHATRLVGLRHGGILFDLPAAEVTDHDLDELYRGSLDDVGR